MSLFGLGLASAIALGSGEIKSKAWRDSNYDWPSQTFKYGAFASLNESAEAVATTSNHLLIEVTRVIPEVGP